MNGNEGNEGNDIAAPELHDTEESATPLVSAGNQMMQAVAVTAGGLAGLVAGAMTAPLALAAAAVANNPAQAGEGAEAEDDEAEVEDERDDDQPSLESETVGEP